MKPLIPIALVAVIGLPGRIEAQGAKAEAKQHIARATELHQQKEFALALDELKTAYALDPQPQLLFAMGQLHVQLGECPQAITYYERYLATRPAKRQAVLAKQAIETCKTAPPPVTPPVAPEPAPAPPVEPAPPPPPSTTPVAPAAEPQVSLQVTPSRERRAWYQNYVADGLVAGGLVAGVTGLLVYRSAVALRDDASSLHDYQAYADHVEDARARRNIAVVVGVGGAALIVAGGIHFALSRRGESAVQIAPQSGGGVVSWSGRW